MTRVSHYYEVVLYSMTDYPEEKIEAEIERLEARSEELDVLLADETVYTNHTKLLEVTKEKDATAERLLELMEQWENLAD